MLKPARLDLRADRWGDWECLFQLGTAGVFVDLAGCLVRMAVRDYPDAPGAALIDLEPLGETDQGTYLVAPATGLVSARIYTATLQALRADYDPARRRRLAWDLRVTDSGGFSEVYLYGAFDVFPGVVQIPGGPAFPPNYVALFEAEIDA